MYNYIYTPIFNKSTTQQISQSKHTYFNEKIGTIYVIMNIKKF